MKPMLLVFLVVQFASAADVTFTKDVAPILQRSCQNCHRSDSIAPMPLLTYEHARPWAKAIRGSGITRNMPACHIDPKIGIDEIKNSVERSEQAIDRMQQEYAYGCHEMT